MKTLVEALPKAQQHARELLRQYQDIGLAGAFGALVITQALGRADAAAASGDVVAMIRSLKELRELK